MMPLFIIVLMCGLRIGEALGMTWDKIDLEERTMEISQQLISYFDSGKHIYKLVPYTKNGEKRTICLPELTVDWLMVQQKNQMGVPNPMNLVFTNDEGNWIKYGQARYQFSKIMEGIGREDVTIHSLRHTAATTVLYTTGDFAAQQRFMGHRSSMTTARYGDVTIEAARAFADAIDAAFAEICAEGLGIAISPEVRERIREIRNKSTGWKGDSFG